LNKLAGPKAKFTYEYDFGDGWEHDIRVEKALTREGKAGHAVCVTGARACPPEDCGGVWGYAMLLDGLADPGNPDFAGRLEWLQEVYGTFGPETFDLEAVNRALARMG